MSSIPIIPNFNDTTPAAPTGRKNVKWLADLLNPSDISVNFQNIGSVNAQTGVTYTLGLADQGKLTTFSNAAAITVTLDSTVPNDFYAAVEDIGVGTATLVPSSGTINGGASISITTGQGGWIFFNGTNWFAVMGGSGGGGGGGSVITTIVAIPSTVVGDFTIAHGLSSAPSSVDVFSTSDGIIRFQPSPSPPWDATLVYLNASTSALTGFLEITSLSGAVGGGALNGVNVQTTNYTALASDNGKLIVFNSGSAVALTLPSPPPSTTWGVLVEDIGAGTLTVNRNGLTIDTVAANLTVSQNQGLYISTDGANYFTERGMGSTLSSPLTTKGDIWGFSTVNARIPIGTNGQWLTADSTQTLGLKWANQPFDLGFQLPGQPQGGTIYLIWEFTRTVLFPANFSGSAGKCLTNPTAATVVFTVLKNGSTVGTVTIASSGAFTFATSGGVSVTYNTTDYMTINTPVGTDATLSDVGWVLAGTR